MEVSVFCQTWQNVDMKLDGGDIAAAAAAAAMVHLSRQRRCAEMQCVGKAMLLLREAKE